MTELDKKRYFIIGTQTYKQEILVCFNMTNKEALTVLKRKNKDTTKEDEEYLLNDKPEHSVEATIYQLSRGYLINMKWRKNSFRYNFCVALHELTHASHFILRNVRIPLNVETEEAYTYLLEELAKQFLFKLY
jgi:hypothetical protein